MKLRRMLCSFLIVAILSVQCYIPVKANRDYLNITLADIIVAWYNASGVAIGSSELFNAIQDTYGSITLDDLVEHDCFQLPGADYHYARDKDLIRQTIGYGSLTAPAIQVRPEKLMTYLNGFPASNVAKESLEAMFGYYTGDGLLTDISVATIGAVIGMVANVGKIGNDIVDEVLEEAGEFWQDLNAWWPVKTLKGVYRKFTDSTYFQDLISTGGGGSDPTPVPSGYEIISEGSPMSMEIFLDPKNYEGAGLYTLPGNNSKFGALVPRDVYVCVLYRPNTGKFTVYFLNAAGTYGRVFYGTWTEDFNIGKYVYSQYSGSTYGFNGFYSLRNGTYNEQAVSDIYACQNIGCCLIVSSQLSAQELFTQEFVEAYNPWNSVEPPESNGVTNYINNAVGNIASDNYINLSPNIGNNEYMYIFDRLTYIEELNQITQNTDNGNYSQNSTVINNYNNQYIQGGVPDVRPTSAPASNPEVQPEMPFVSPRPTQPPEFVEQVVQEGGISEEITSKFPFCIPWDIKALIDNLWAPEARAPYIHWEATFGEWGKLGEVNLDFSEFDPAARIFRSTTLLLWIVGLVLITRNLIG